MFKTPAWRFGTHARYSPTMYAYEVSEPRKVLIVGGGAVGQVYGHHLCQAGDDVTFYVRSKYRDEFEAGLYLHCTGYGGTKKVPLGTKSAIDSIAAVAATGWDEVWLCVSSTALYGDWLGELITAAEASVVVTLQPGLEVRATLLKHVDERQLVTGAIPFIAWQTPLPGASAPKGGIQFWLPPFSSSPFSGQWQSVESITRRLRRGGLRANHTSDAAEWAATPSAIMMPHIAGLECEGWSMRQFRRSSTLALSTQATHEAMAVAATVYGMKHQRLLLWVLRPLLMRCLLFIADYCVPFDLETYLKYHFTKVGEQTRVLLAEYARTAEGFNLSFQALKQLQNRLPNQASGLASDK